MRAHRTHTQDVPRLFAEDPKHRLLLVRAVWARSVGADLVRRTLPETLEHDVLRVRVPDTRWRQVLHRMQPQLLAQLRAVLGDLAPRRLSFVEGGLDEAGPTTTPAPTAASSFTAAPLPPSVARAATAIADADIRARFEASAARYLTRGAALPAGDPTPGGRDR